MEMLNQSSTGEPLAREEVIKQSLGGLLILRTAYGKKASAFSFKGRLARAVEPPLRLGG